MGLGFLAGLAATYVMDVVTELLYTEHIAQRERELQSQPSTHVIAQKILSNLELDPVKKDIEKIGPLLHWALGASSGIVGGVLAQESAAPAGMAVATGMFLFDEVGLSLLGAAPPSSSYPWQTNLRSLLGHAAYGFTFAMAFEALRALSPQG
ncbi:MAG: hypothetical protein M3Z37_11360 [Candidatus Eremiobacteraeota bacterium]|nr:hypothetical protein [Candidatus Eremiobacteraeota bacterium]